MFLPVLLQAIIGFWYFKKKSKAERKSPFPDLRIKLGRLPPIWLPVLLQAIIGFWYFKIARKKSPLPKILEAVDPRCKVRRKLVSKLYCRQNFHKNIYLSRGIRSKLILATGFKKYRYINRFSKIEQWILESS